MSEIIMYCVKCRQKKATVGLPLIVTFKNGKRAFTGKCSNCGTAMFEILKAPIEGKTFIVR